MKNPKIAFGLVVLVASVVSSGAHAQSQRTVSDGFVPTGARLNTPASSRASKESCNLDMAGVRACPTSGGGVLAENLYPAASVSISDGGGNTQFVTNFVTRVMREQRNNPPRIYLTGTPETKTALLRVLAREFPRGTSDPNYVKWRDAIVDVAGLKWNWQQDFYKGTVGSDGRPVYREIAPYRNRSSETAGIDQLFTNIADKVRDCGFKTDQPIGAPADSLRGGHMGGNIVGMPDGACLVGDDHFQGDEFGSFASSACGSAKVIQAPTKFLAVGHTDEIVSFIRTKGRGAKAPCDFAAVVASPKKAIDALTARPTGKFFSYTSLTPYDQALRIGRTPQFADMCAKILRRPDLESKPSPTKSGSSVSWIRTILPTAFADDNTDAAKYMPCANITNAQFLEYYNGSDMQKYNDAVQLELDGFKKKLNDEMDPALKAQCGGRGMDFIDVPDLFSGRIVQRDNGSYGMAEGSKEPPTSGISLFSNPANLVQIGDKVFFPEPGNTAFRAAIHTRMQIQRMSIEVQRPYARGEPLDYRLGMDEEYVDTYFAHRAQGNLHCSTNVVRYCNPDSTAPGRISR